MPSGRQYTAQNLRRGIGGGGFAFTDNGDGDEEATAAVMRGIGSGDAKLPKQ